MKIRPILVLIVVALIGAGTAQAQKLYRWVDEDGNVHYSDKVPPEQKDLARDELNKEGMVVERVERAMTPEEKAAKKAAEEALREANREREEQRRKDAVLLESYASEEDIMRTRDQKLQAIERTINITDATVDSQERALADLIKRAGDVERAGQEVSAALRTSIESTQQQIASQKAFKSRKEAERKEIEEQAEYDLKRYRAAMGRTQENDDPAESEPN